MQPYYPFHPVELNENELNQAREAAREQVLWVKELDEKDLGLWGGLDLRDERKTIQKHFAGIAGDIAAAKALGIQWKKRPFMRFRGSLPDLEPNIFAMFRSHTGYSLIVRLFDPEDSYHVLVNGPEPSYDLATRARFNIAGFISKVDARRLGKLHDFGGRRGQVYEVGWYLLHHIEELRRIIHA